MLGPLPTGLAIELMGPWLEGTQGYAAMFLVASAATLLSIPFLRTAIAGGDHDPTRGPAPEAAPISSSVRSEP